jgi:CubicO group peptidase (beta-lactamase class C family)
MAFMKKYFGLLAIITLLQLPFGASSQAVKEAADSIPVAENATAETEIADSLSPEPSQQSDRQAADSIRMIRGVPGIAFAVFTEDSVLEESVIGYRTFRSKDTIRMKDRFLIGTNTVAFTAYIAARLVEAGKIKWNTPLLKIFPEFKKKAFPVYQSITLEDLLTSRTRIQPFNSLDDWYRIPDVNGNIIAKRKAFTFYMLQQKPNMENFLQKKIVFSVAGYVMAAAMLEKVSGKTWEDLLTEYVRKPLKISIRYSWPLLSDTSQPSGHWSRGGYFRSEDRNTWVKINPVLYPAQEINISLPDYVKFMQENLAGLNGKKAHLSKSTFEYMHFGALDYAMGWNNGSLNDQSFSFHEGLSLMFDCRAELVKEKKRGIIVMCNSGDKDGRGAVLHITRMLEGKYF